jgi:heat shock protein HslJ/membrane-bound inhibitor of C-type lysozyme
MTSVRQFAVWFSLFTLALITGCDSPQSETAAQTALVISGQATASSKLPATGGSTLTLRLQNLAALPENKAIIAEKTIVLNKQQRPLPFELRVFRDQIRDDTPYALRILLQTSEGELWTADQLYSINRDMPQLELGDVNLSRAFDSEMKNHTGLFVCGSKTVKTRLQKENMQLHLDDDILHLKQVTAASGAKYQSAGGQVVFWQKGDRAMLTTASFDWPQCTQVSEHILALFPFNAHGNEPGWALSAEVNEVVLNWNYGRQRLVMPNPQLDLTHSGFVLHSKANERLLKINVLHSLCRDSMSGKPYPQHVEVHFDDKHLRGCGGDSDTLLTGEEWVVEDINNRGIIDFSRVTLKFDDKGRLSGQASCNQYTTTYEFREGLDIAGAITTRKACAPALMQQEELFLALLRDITRLDFTPRGALLLTTSDGKSITARR